MEAKELRPMNLVTVENKKSWPELSGVAVIVCGIGENIEPTKAVLFPKSKYCVRVCDNDRNNYNQFEEFIKPIPLTEEWLVKFDFEKIKHIHGYSFWTLSKSKRNKCHIDIYETKTLFAGYVVENCKYVHQLQNLYWCLCGKELELNTQK